MEDSDPVLLVLPADHVIQDAATLCATISVGAEFAAGDALLTFGIKGGFDAGVKFYDALEMFLRLVNIGDVKSLAAHPASTTHRQLSDEELKLAGLLYGGSYR